MYKRLEINKSHFDDKNHGFKKIFSNFLIGKPLVINSKRMIFMNENLNFTEVYFQKSSQFHQVQGLSKILTIIHVDVKRKAGEIKIFLKGIEPLNS